MKRKRNIRNIIAALIAKVVSEFHLTSQKYMFRQMLLWLYGYNDLNLYISDKQINTFVWRDAIAEEKFVRYKEFMGKVFEGLTMEIEERQ